MTKTPLIIVLNVLYQTALLRIINNYIVVDLKVKKKEKKKKKLQEKKKTKIKQLKFLQKCSVLQLTL